MEVPSSKIDMSFSCQDLPKLDIGSKSDPMLIIYTSAPHKSSEWFEIGRTEVAKDESNPTFTTHIQMEYRFEEVQPIRIVVVDIDDPKAKDIRKQDMIGAFETRLASIMTAAGQEKTGPLVLDEKVRGIVTVRCEELVESKQSVTFQFSGDKLDSKDFFGKSDPLLKIYRQRDNHNWELVHTTETVKNTSNAIWNKFTVTLTKLCNSNVNRPLKFECLDWDSDGTTELIGSAELTFQDLLSGKKTFNFVNPNKKKNDGVAGHLSVLFLQVANNNTFLDYICGGCEVSLITAIDFTASNGLPSDPTSLHNIASGHNQYEKVIQAVGKILEPYDTDGIIQTYGFGGKWNGQVSHCHPLTPSSPGVQGVLNVYRETLQNVSLFGPTNLESIVQMASRSAGANQSQQNQKYTVLLILTDGVITDMEKTIAAIIEGSSQPLSIIIVGVGLADFTDMNRLDSDDKLLSINGLTAKRDIVQFVPFRDFQQLPVEALAKHTLAEIPSQFLAHMKSVGFVPNPPKPKAK